MSRRKTERLLSLVVCLLSTRRYLTAEQIRQAVTGYPDQPEAFKRMFERDKEELRELGIPLETGPISPLDGEDTGYRVQRQAYEKRRSSGWPPGSGSTPSWPGRRRARCSSCARPVSTPTTPARTRGRASSRAYTPPSRPSARCGRRCGTAGR
jgi:hypothetical protein